MFGLYVAVVFTTLWLRSTSDSPASRWYTSLMPTARHRYQITETDEVARALDAAERRWPGEPRSRLIVRLVTENGEVLTEVSEAEAERRRAAVEAIAGTFPGLSDPRFLKELRDEWPE